MGELESKNIHFIELIQTISRIVLLSLKRLNLLNQDIIKQMAERVFILPEGFLADDLGLEVETTEPATDKPKNHPPGRIIKGAKGVVGGITRLLGQTRQSPIPAATQI